MIINKYGDSRQYLKHGVITTMELAELYIHMTRVFNSALPGYKESSESALLEMKDKTICITKSPSQMYEIILQHLLSTFMSEVTELHRNHKNCSSYLPIYRFDFT
jgi:triphosphoribosyl-dephospho-CoA synthetase